jgi:hypothetical protein
MGFNVRLCIGDADDSTGYDDGWCYPKSSYGLAVQAWAEWSGDGDPPDGWIKNINTGRRRPDGTPESEVQW